MKQNRQISYSILKHALTIEFGVPESEHNVFLKIFLCKQHYKKSYDDLHKAVVAMNMRLQNPLPDYTLLNIIKRNISGYEVTVA